MRDVLLVVLGACGALLVSMVCEELFMWLLRPAGKRCTVTLLPIAGDCRDLEPRLRWQLFCLRAHPCRRGERLLIVDCGASEQTLLEADTFCRGKSDVLVCTADQLKRIIREDTVYKAVEVVLY